MAITVIVVFALVAIAIIGFLTIMALVAADHCAAWVLSCDGFPGDPEHGLVGGFLSMLPISGVLLFLGGIGSVICLVGVEGIQLVVVSIILLVDAIFLYLSLVPGAEVKARRSEMLRNFAGNRPLFLLNMFVGTLLFALVALVLYPLGAIPRMVGPWIYGGVVVEVFVVAICVTFMEVYDTDSAKRDWNSRKLYEVAVRNIVLVVVAIALVYILAIGIAPAANTYNHFMTPEEGKSVGVLMQVWAVASAFVVLCVTAPFSPLWVPIYCFGLLWGLLSILAEVGVSLFVMSWLLSPAKTDAV